MWQTIISSGLGILAAVVGWIVRESLTSNREFRNALNEATRALAVLVEKDSADRADIDEAKTSIATLTTRHNDLATSTAILADRVNRHEQWSQREHERVLARLEHFTPARRTGGT